MENVLDCFFVGNSCDTEENKDLQAEEKEETGTELAVV